MEDTIKLIGERLKGLRDVLDLSVEEMAETCAITNDEYVAMENGEEALKEIADFVTKSNNKEGVAYCLIFKAG